MANLVILGYIAFGVLMISGFGLIGGRARPMHILYGLLILFAVPKILAFVTGVDATAQQQADAERKQLELDKVAVAALLQARALSEAGGQGVEYGGIILEVNGKYVAQTPVKGEVGTIKGSAKMDGLVREGYVTPARDGFTHNGISYAASYHVHPRSTWLPPFSLAQNAYNRFFSAADLSTSVKTGLKEYLMTSHCNVRLFTPSDEIKAVHMTALGEVHPSVWWNAFWNTRDVVDLSGTGNCI